MNRMKSVFAALACTAIVCIVPQAKAQTVQVILAGSSAQWQTLALGAYNAGKCVSGGTAPCSHYTNSSFNLTDSRPTTKGGTAAVDSGKVWIVWDSASPANVWAFVSVDSGVGDRCYFAQPHCSLSVTTFPAAGNLIPSSLWGDGSSDSTPSAAIQGLFTSGTTLVNAAATDIRYEDALFATCRTNSKLGNSPAPNPSTDGLGGLGYGANASGVCAKFGDALADLEGSDILSGYPASTSTAHVLAFAISGKDPFTGTAVPTATTVAVGAAPVVFIIERTAALAGAENITDQEAQTLFSGANCNGNVVGGAGGPISVYLREPLSGTMNTTEYTVFRYWNYSGASQETGVAAQNPLSKACTAGGDRFRAIGTGEEVKSVLNSVANNGNDGIGYAFFSYGNISSIANSSSYGYLTLDGIDGIFHKYGTTIDPGQPATAGELPAAANLPASCAGAFPCAEGKIWSGNLSYPNLRNGSYRAWTDLRAVSNGTPLTALKTLITSSQSFVVTTEPDFVPAVKVGLTDPGLPLLRSHYTQEGVAPINVSANGDRGGDAGGCILTSTGSVTTSDTTTTLVQVQPGSSCVSIP
jgi:hypothetical protein